MKMNLGKNGAAFGLFGLLTSAMLLQISPATGAPLDQSLTRSAARPSPEVAPKHPSDREYEELKRLQEQTAQEIEQLARRSDEAMSNGDKVRGAEWDRKLDLQMSRLRKAYQDFLRWHPNHSAARIDFGQFLFENGEEQEAVRQWERAAKADPKNPEAWNNLAHYYQHRGPVKNAFRYYTKAIALDPAEPVFLRNLAGAIYVFRKDAREYYRLTERQVFDKAIQLYRQALKLDPTNFQLATELAESFYLIKPLPAPEALQAWKDAFAIAQDDFQRETVYLHMARVEMNSGLLDQARQHLDSVTNSLHNTVKGPLVSTLQRRAAESKDKALPPAATNGR